MKFQTTVGPVTGTYHGALEAENKITGIANAPEFKMEGEFSATRYKLVWSDEFNQDGKPDPKKWTYETGFVRNEELQWYQPDNTRCENGLRAPFNATLGKKPAVAALGKRPNAATGCSLFQLVQVG
jgi:hypothetical protein